MTNLTDAQARARLDDLTFMAATGETAHGAAKRLGISFDALEKWCAARPERRRPWRQLTANSHTAGRGARRGSVTPLIA